jgi:tetratricopeptide (TPR) repeat protein
MTKSIRKVLQICLLPLVVTAPVPLHAQEEWPHYSRSWSDPLFRARVQGVYDWIGSGPDNLSQYDYYQQSEGQITLNSVPFYRKTTENRDITTFPPRAQIDPVARFIEPPKDWVDRERLIQYMSSTNNIQEGYFEEAVDEEASPDTYFLMANLYFLQSKFADAVTSYIEAIDRYPNFRLAHKNLSFAYFVLGDCEQALSSATTAVDLGIMSARVSGLRAYCALQQNKPQTAVEAIGFARLIDPQNKVWRRLELQALIGAGRHEQATLLLETELVGSALTEFHLSAMTILYSTQENQDALLSVLEISNRAGLLSDSMLLELSRLKIQYGLAHLISLEDLTSYANSSSTTGAQISDLLDSLGNASAVNVATDFSSSTIDQLDFAMSQTKRAAVLLGEATTLANTRNYSQARMKVDEVLAIGPMSCEALILSAEIYTNRDQYAQADSMLKRIERSSRDCADANLVRRAQIYFDRGSYARALELFQLDSRKKSIDGIRLDRRHKAMIRALENLVQTNPERETL